MMYAVIKTGGKQYKVAEGLKLKVEKLEANQGDNIEFNDVLLLSDGQSLQVGTPLLTSCKVTATVQSQGRAKKIKIIKHKRRKNHHKQMGHRQYFTEVKITGLFASDQKLATQPPGLVAEGTIDANA